MRRLTVARAALIGAVAAAGLLAVGPANGDAAQPPAGAKATPAHPDPVGSQPAPGSRVSTVHPGTIVAGQPGTR
jgi:hypothetical protein